MKLNIKNINTIIQEDAEPNVSTTPAEKKSFFGVLVIFVSVITILINLFVFQLAKVNGNSMLPTLEDKEVLLLYKLNPKIERGDIIVFRQNDGILIKRVIGLPGETITIDNDSIEINGEKIEDYIKVTVQNGGGLSEPYEIKEGEYICLGDNRNNSHDSRAFGAVKEEDVIGIVLFRFNPFTKY